MKDYSKMSDFEINKELIALECNDGKVLDYLAFADGATVGLYHKSSDYYDWLNYCNNPSDAWPIINRERIGVYPSEGPEFMPWIAAKNAISVTDKNPLRAAMIVYLMMKDEEK